ncbi:MAG: 30S ribosomal protein S16 [Gammaproteobacteria bacterium]|nr:30S ribosomal protein S16 [Gammaproteobacteria bacterium]MCY4255358.1 30S ribosomal protein S16 [Gammaproteobacteria bacterium]
MVGIRLSRHGAKKRPFYHIVVTDRRNKRNGRFIERLGFYNPIATGGEQSLRLELDRVDYWLGQGAQPSDKVRQLIRRRRMEGAVAVEAPPQEAASEQPAEGGTEPKEAEASKTRSVDEEPAVEDEAKAAAADTGESEEAAPAGSDQQDGEDASQTEKGSG